MNYKQLVTPNLDPVIYQNGRVLLDWLGYCLAYAQTAFGAPWAGNSAWEAWEKCKHRHPDKMIPKGVYVLLWFSHWGKYGYPAKYANWGHVAIQAPDGRIWSSPDDHKYSADVFGSIAEIESALRCTFQGWSEDIGGKRIIEPKQGDIMDTEADVVLAYNNFRGGRGVLGQPDANEIAYWKGKPFKTILEAARGGEVVSRNAQFGALMDFYDAWSSKVAELSTNPTKAELKALQDALAVERERVLEVEKQLAEELAQPAEIKIEERVIYQNVNVPLSWKTVRPFLIQEFNKFITRFRK